MLALARSAGPFALATTPAIRAQNDFLRPASALVFGLGAGAFRLLPVARLYLARPFAVRPAPLDTGSFSPRPTASDTDFFGIRLASKSVLTGRFCKGCKDISCSRLIWLCARTCANFKPVRKHINPLSGRIFYCCCISS